MTRKIKKSLALILSILVLMSVMPMGASMVVETITTDLFNYTIEDGKATVIAYNGDETVTEVAVPNEVEGYPVVTIGSGVFLGEANITEIILGDNITSIDAAAFKNCKGLKSITIGKNVSFIGESAFLFCTNLKTVNFGGTQVEWIALLENAENNNGVLCSEELVVNFASSEHICNELQRIDSTEGTCTKKGTIEYWCCSECETKYADANAETPIDSIESTINPDKHNYKWVAGVQATCVVNGNKGHYRCKDCAKYFLISTTDPKTETTLEDITRYAPGHNFSEEITEPIEATCNSTGMNAYKTCTKCGNYFAADEHDTFAAGVEDASSFVTDIDAEKHVYNDYFTIDTQATCTEAGEKSKHCSNANCEARTEITAIPARQHNFINIEDSEDNRDASCTEVGAQAKRCTNTASDEYAACNHIEVVEVAAKGHDLKHQTGKEATCTTNGYIEYWRCQRTTCNKAFLSNDVYSTNDYTGAIIIPASHTLEKTDAKEPTCTEPGNIEYWTCTASACGKYFIKNGEALEEINLEDTVRGCIAHIATYVEQSNKTCTEDGMKAHYACSVCEKMFMESACTTELTKEKLTLKAEGHKTTKVDAVAKTCTTNGNIEHWNCTVCNENFEDEAATKELKNVVIPSSHELKFNEDVKPTCTSEGKKEHYLCTVCSKTFTDSKAAFEIEPERLIVPANRHDDYSVIGKDATCTEEGSLTYVGCRTCGKLFTDKDFKTEIKIEDTIIPALEHDWSSNYIDGKDGKHYKPCKRTGCEAVNEDSAKEHVWDSGEVIKDSTCTETGSMKYTCTIANCTATKTVEIEKKPHTEVYYEQPATCTEPGKKGETWCTVCKQFTAEAEIIPATGHAWVGVDENYKAATCTTDASGERKCSVCGLQEVDTTLAHHTYPEAWTPKKPATCTKEGEEIKLCEVCKTPESVISNPIPALNHVGFDTYVIDENEVDGTCTTEATWDKVTRCAGCDNAISSVAMTGTTDPTNHIDIETDEAYDTYVIDKNEVAGTCKAEATWDKVTYCGGCDAKLSTEPKTGTKDATNHVDGVRKVDEDIVAGTCTAVKTWNEVTYCNGCNAELDSVAKTGVMDAANHKDVETGEAYETYAIDENEAAGTCKAEATWDKVTYCGGCDAKLSTEPKTGAKDEDNHVDGVSKVDENIVVGTCKAEKTWNEVTYCNGCETVLNTVAKKGEKDAANHVDGVLKVEENVVAGTCESVRKWNEVTYCTGCDAKLSTEPKTGAKDTTNHVGGVHTEIKNIVEGTCTVAKTWNEVKCCNDCNAELDSVAKTGNKNPANHVGGERKVEENVVAGTCKTERKWNEVTYCKGCNDKLKTEPKTGAKDLNNHKWSEEVTEHYRECENGCNAKLPVDHSYEGDFRTIKEATCKEAGLKVKYCKYCHNDVEFEIAKTNNHTDNNKDYKCDLCEIELEKPEQDEAGTDNNKPAQDPSANCSCSCHKSGMANLIFRIILFFEKLFGANKTCGCGKSHY